MALGPRYSSRLPLSLIRHLTVTLGAPRAKPLAHLIGQTRSLKSGRVGLTVTRFVRLGSSDSVPHSGPSLATGTQHTVHTQLTHARIT